MSDFVQAGYDALLLSANTRHHRRFGRFSVHVEDSELLPEISEDLGVQTTNIGNDKSDSCQY